MTKQCTCAEIFFMRQMHEPKGCVHCSGTSIKIEVKVHFIFEHKVNTQILGGIPFFSSNLWSKFFQCYCIVTRECHISPKCLCRELSKFTHYFDQVAMATLLALWLAKHGKGCNYLAKCRMLTMVGALWKCAQNYVCGFFIQLPW